MAGHPPGDGPPPPPRHAAPTGHADRGDSVGPPHPHSRAHSTWVAGPNNPPSGRAVGGGGAPDLRRPSQRWKAPPLVTPFRHPHSKQRRPARAHTVEPVLGPHARSDSTRNTRVAVPRLPAPEDGRSEEGQRLTADAPHNNSPKQGGGEPGPDRPPPRHTRRSKGPGQDTRRGTDHVERPYQRPVPGPREVRTPHHPGRGERTLRERERTHTQRARGDYQKATGPSSWNAQTAWNGVPASEGKGHPDGTARHTQCGTRGAGWGKRERHNTRYQPEPPEPATSATHTRRGHCTRQGSSGALRHARTPRLGSLRASPRGSHWRQASSTGPAAPPARVTTH